MNPDRKLSPEVCVLAIGILMLSCGLKSRASPNHETTTDCLSLYASIGWTKMAAPPFVIWYSDAHSIEVLKIVSAARSTSESISAVLPSPIPELIHIQLIPDKDLFEKCVFAREEVAALAYASSATIVLNPVVLDAEDTMLQSILAHEIAHIYAFQRFPKTLPVWLDEGIAARLGRISPLDHVQIEQPFRLHEAVHAIPTNESSDSKCASIVDFIISRRHSGDFRGFLEFLESPESVPFIELCCQEEFLRRLETEWSDYLMLPTTPEFHEKPFFLNDALRREEVKSIWPEAE